MENQGDRLDPARKQDLSEELGFMHTNEKWPLLYPGAENDETKFLTSKIFF